MERERGREEEGRGREGERGGEMVGVGVVCVWVLCHYNLIE